jgi:hypothetical protein
MHNQYPHARNLDRKPQNQYLDACGSISPNASPIAHSAKTKTAEQTMNAANPIIDTTKPTTRGGYGVASGGRSAHREGVASTCVARERRNVPAGTARYAQVKPQVKSSNVMPGSNNHVMRKVKCGSRSKATELGAHMRCLARKPSRYARNTKPETQYPKLDTRNPKPEPETQTPKPQTPNPKPTQSPKP